MKYLKKFEQKALYESYINNSPILPNVSYIVDTDGVFYNPQIEPIIPTLKIQGSDEYGDWEFDGYNVYDLLYHEEPDNTFAEHNKALYDFIINNGYTEKVNIDGDYNYPELSVEMTVFDPKGETHIATGYGYSYTDKEQDAERNNYYDQWGEDCVVLHGYNEFSVEWIILFSDGREIVYIGD